MERPEDAEASAEGRDRQVADVVASELKGTVVADSGLGVWREGGKAIDLFEDGEVGVGMVDGLEAAEGLVMLVEAPDYEFDGVVGGRDGVIADAVGELGPVTLQEIEDSGGLRYSLDIVWTQGQHGFIALGSLGGGLGIENVIDLLYRFSACGSPGSGTMVSGCTKRPKDGSQ